MIVRQVRLRAVVLRDDPKLETAQIPDFFAHLSGNLIDNSSGSGSSGTNFATDACRSNRICA